MGAHPHKEAIDIEALLEAEQEKSLLRFITCGSVDDGKSTLIGRLLLETEAVLEDQLAAVEAASRRHGTAAGGTDLALLVDGLAAEREQGITIDVAYRYFSTKRRKFIIADTPGHEQYTRNMATGASTADLAILLVDARKGVLAQTRRHALIVSLLGIKEVIVAVNKMDLVGWSEERFRRIEEEIRRFAAELGFEKLTFVPLSALTGDNIAERSMLCHWHEGPTLLSALEAAEPSERSLPFRMAVQGVNRPHSDFRGFYGLVSSGSVARGGKVAVLPSGSEATVARILDASGEAERAVAGQSVTLTLAEEVDVARGDILCAPEAPAQPARALNATLLWMDSRPSRRGGSYLLKIGTSTANATLSRIGSRIDLTTLAKEKSERLELNDIGEASLVLDRVVALDPYLADRATGGFILIDRETLDTVAMGLVREARADYRGFGLHPLVKIARRFIASASESSLRSLFKAVSWRCFGSLDTTFLAFLFTGNLKLSAAIGTTEIATKIALYYFHERLWTRVPFGKS